MGYQNNYYLGFEKKHFIFATRFIGKNHIKLSVCSFYVEICYYLSMIFPGK
jgi:hypothetical protein